MAGVERRAVASDREAKVVAAAAAAARVEDLAVVAASDGAKVVEWEAASEACLAAACSAAAEAAAREGASTVAARRVEVAMALATGTGAVVARSHPLAGVAEAVEGLETEVAAH